ncbi:MAG: NAD/NADP octopine/nopaline dehydrogenase family protein [Burkholderiaceae bacterium]
MKISILGGGHGSYAAAADLSEQAHSVALWRRSAGQFGSLASDQTLQLKDHKGQRAVRLDRVTADLAEAMEGAELILVFTPAFAQENIARAMAPHLTAGQVVFLAPGSLGSMAMAAVVRSEGGAAATWAETGTLPYLARKHDEQTVAITVRAKHLPTGVFPADNTAAAMAVIQAAYPSVHSIEDALSGALMNAGPIIHPPLILMNAGPLEHFDSWDIHNEGTQPAIRRVTDRLDAERIAVREALGYAPNHYPLADHYNTDRWMYGDAHDRLTDSGDWREKIELTSHRYMTEDVAYGLGLLVSIARYANSAAPIANSLHSLGQAVCSDQFQYGARSLESLGLADMSAGSLRRLLKDGY